MEIKKSPIEVWEELISNCNNEFEIKEKLKDVYLNNKPNLAELIFNSHCSSNCKHCIYPTNYHIFNKNLAFNIWEKIADKLYNLGLRTFILGGRQLTRKHIKFVYYLKNKYDDIKVGLIADGPAIMQLKDDLLDSPIDWLDVSLDGMEKEHNEQRNSKTSFKQTIDFLKEAKKRIEKLTVLICVTTINQHSIIDLIQYLNKDIGIKNIIINPVTIYDNRIPDPKLMIDEKTFIDLIKKIEGILPT